jgi:glucose/arabinose dehydrogenase
MKMRAILIILILVLLGLGSYSYLRTKYNLPVPSLRSKISILPTPTPGQEIPGVSVVAKNLEIPWAIAFLPDGRMLVTERPGRVRIISKDGTLQSQPLATISGVREIGEGGLLGIAVHPNFERNKFVYLYYTYGENGGLILNRIVRLSFEGNSLANEKTILEGIPAASNHDGGRIKFGPDGYLYVATGDAQEPSRSQDKDSPAGKILRLTDEGAAAPGNPFGSLVYSLGHRNPQGLAWDESGNLWGTEHGSSAYDEVNKIIPGNNYGWPTVRGDATGEGFTPPVIHSGSDTWAPSGAVFLEGSLYFAGLRGQALYQLTVSSNSLKTHLKGQYGRLREATLGPDGMLYLSTSNRDGRGDPMADDDRILRINPAKL